jgi:hypothetical protein
VFVDYDFSCVISHYCSAEFLEKSDLPFFFLQSILTSIVLKSNVTMLDIVSTRMLGQYGFLAKVH